MNWPPPPAEPKAKAREMHDGPALAGAQWTFAGFVVERSIGVGTTLMLAHVLVPHDFGLIALSTLVLGFLSGFSDLGLTSVVVYRARIDQRERAVLLFFVLVIGVALSLLVVGTAGIAAAASPHSSYPPVLAALAPTIALGNMGWFFDCVLQRHFAFGRYFGSQAVQAVVYPTIAIPLAFAGAGVWSLVAGITGAALSHAYVSAAMSPWQVRLKPGGRSDLRSFAREGRGFVVQGGLTFLEQNVDFLITGAALGARKLGLYSMAYRVGELPTVAIAQPAIRVMFPRLSRARPADAATRGFMETSRLVAFLAVPFALIASGTARPLVDFALGSAWNGSIGPLQILGAWGALRAVQITFAWFLNSQGHPGMVARTAGVAFAISAPIVVLAALGSGATAVAAVMLLQATGLLAAYSRMVSGLIGITLSEQLRALGPFIPAGAACWAAARLTTGLLDRSLGDLPLLVLGSGAGLAAFLLVCQAVDRRLVRNVRAQLRDALRPGVAPA